MWLSVLLTVLIGYLLGNLNGAVIMSHLLSHKDIRQQGSGNAGLTNFLRVYNPGCGVMVICIDMLKAVAACLLGKLLLAPYGYSQEGLMVGGLAVVLGHDFPAFLGFHGGKGVLSGVTVALVADWRCGLIALGVFALCLFFTRYVSLSSILGTLSFAVAFGIIHWGNPFVVTAGWIVALLIVVMHKDNIARLLKGTEKKATFSKFKKNSTKSS